MVTEQQRRQLLYILSDVTSNMNTIIEEYKKQTGKDITVDEINEAIDFLKSVKGS